MAANKIHLIGNLGSDPELRYTQGAGTAVCNFRLATTEKFKGRDGTRQEETQWHTIICWAGTAEVAGKYLKKGRQVYIEGRLKYRRFTDRNDTEREVAEIHVSELQMLGGKDNEHQGDQSYAGPGGDFGPQGSDADIPF